MSKKLLYVNAPYRAKNTFTDVWVKTIKYTRNRCIATWNHMGDREKKKCDEKVKKKKKKKISEIADMPIRKNAFSGVFDLNSELP